MNQYMNIYNYLRRYGIGTIEEIVGKTVYHVFPRQGVVGYTVKKIEFTEKTKEWCFTTNCSHKLVELGESVFFDKKEAREYEILQLHQRTLNQQQYIVNQRIEERNRDLNKLNFLLEHYPTPESRCKFVKQCDNCSHNKDGIIEGRVTCAEFGKKENCYFWQPDVEAFQKWAKKHKIE